MTSTAHSITRIETIKDHLHRFFDGGNWVTDGAFKKLSALPSNMAFQRVTGHHHTIAGLLGHMIAWRSFVLARLTGDDSFDIDNPSTDWPSTGSWPELLDDFKTSHEQLTRALDAFDSAKMDLIVAGRTYRYAFMLDGLIQHDYYHYGQIGALMAHLTS